MDVVGENEVSLYLTLTLPARRGDKRHTCSITNEAELLGNKIVLLPLAPCGRGSSRLRMLMSITDTGEG